jgi:hypothetical protein
MRVPWVTARIVLGLCQAGKSYDNNEVVQAACDWLRRPVTAGGALDLWWRSGTGQWNSDEATTAMVLTALHRAGAPPTAGTETALAWLLGRRSSWQRPDHEIDLALVVEAFLVYGVGGEQLQDGVLALLQWALTVPDGGLPSPDSPVPEDNLRLPFVAAQLTVVIWQTMLRELTNVIGHELRPFRPTVRAVESEPSVALSPGDLAEWHRRADMIRSTLASEIERRESIATVPAVRDQLLRLRSRLDRLNDLDQILSGRTPHSIVEELEAMGQAECKDRWPKPIRSGS